MFCTKCGSNVPDGSAFCTSCGAVMGGNNAAPTEKAAPAVPVGLSKSQYLASYASPAAKKFSLASRLGAVLCIILFVVSYFAALSTSIEDLPIITNIAGVVGADTDELKDAKSDMKDALEEMEEIYDKYEDDLSSDEKKACEGVIDAAKDFSKSMSINNSKNVIKAVEKFGKLDFDEAKEVEDIVKGEIDESVKTVEDILNIISAIVLVFMLLPCIFAALGGFLRIRGLVIAGLVFLLFYGLTFCPLVMLVILFVVHVALIVITSKINGEYKTYRMTTFYR